MSFVQNSVLFVFDFICMFTEWMDQNGNIHKWSENQIGQDLSELLQHEIDHLDGILSPDRAIDQNSLVFREILEKNKLFYAKTVDYMIS